MTLNLLVHRQPTHCCRSPFAEVLASLEPSFDRIQTFQDEAATGSSELKAERTELFVVARQIASNAISATVTETPNDSEEPIRTT